MTMSSNTAGGLLIFLPFPKTFWSNIVTFKILNKPLKVFLL